MRASRIPALLVPVLLVASMSATAQDAPTPPPLPTEATTPPPLPVASVYIAEDGAQAGPFTLTELRDKVDAGTLTASTLAWQDGMADWQAAGSVDDLAILFEDDAAVTPDAPAGDIAASGDTLAPDFLVGTWRQQASVPMEGIGTGSADLTVDLGADGRFAMTGEIVLTFQQEMRLAVDGSGTYTATLRGSDQIEVVLTGEVTMTPPAGLATPETEPMNETTLYTVVDADTIRDAATGDTLTRVN